MAVCKFSERAESDLDGIAAQSIRDWGPARADRYLDDLNALCQDLANNPGLGHACDHVRPGLRRLEEGRHVIFYRRRDAGGIRVVRILHDRMRPELHVTDEDDADE
jgi:toxin ParE1/3/4